MARINAQEKMQNIADWLDFQHESLSFGLHNFVDAEKLFDYWNANNTLPEFCDEASDDPTIDVAEHRVKALGYDPLAPTTDTNRTSVSDKVKLVLNWLKYQYPSMSSGIRCLADAEKLYDYWQANGKTLPEFADKDPDDESVNVADQRVKAIGYDPMSWNLKLFRHRKQHSFMVETKWDDEQGDPVLYHRQGGGFEQSLSNAEFHAQFELAEEPVMRKGQVSAEFAVGGKSFPCWSDGKVWNGSGMPYFERHVVDELMREGYGPIKWVGDTVVAQMSEDPNDIDEFEMVLTPDGTPVWGVGAGYWTWDRVVFPAEDAVNPSANTAATAGK